MFEQKNDPFLVQFSNRATSQHGARRRKFVHPSIHGYELSKNDSVQPESSRDRNLMGFKSGHLNTEDLAELNKGLSSITAQHRKNMASTNLEASQKPPTGSVFKRTTGEIASPHTGKKLFTDLS